MHDVRVMAKTLAFRAVSFLSTLLLARLWFGDWHVSGFQLFLLVYCSAIYYGFERVWERLAPTPQPQEDERENP